MYAQKLVTNFAYLCLVQDAVGQSIFTENEREGLIDDGEGGLQKKIEWSLTRTYAAPQGTELFPIETFTAKLFAFTFIFLQRVEPTLRAK